MLDLHRLLALHTFAAKGTIAAAAESLGFSPAAVSQQLATLEREVGVTLLERSPRSATLTPAGAALAARASEVLGAAEDARSAALAAAGTIAGTIAVSTIPTATILVASALADFIATEDQVTTVLRQAGPADALRQLRAHELDIAVIDAWQPVRGDDDILHVALARDPLLLVLPAEHPRPPARGSSLRPSDIAQAIDGHTWLCAPPDEPSRSATDRVLEHCGGGPRARWEVEGLATIGQLVGKGIGVALLPELALRELPAGKVTTYPLRPSQHRQLFAAIRRSSRRHPLISATVEALTLAMFREGSSVRD